MGLAKWYSLLNATHIPAPVPHLCRNIQTHHRTNKDQGIQCTVPKSIVPEHWRGYRPNWCLSTWRI